MNKTNKFIILTFLLLFSRVGDFWTTLMATPYNQLAEMQKTQ